MAPGCSRIASSSRPTARSFSRLPTYGSPTVRRTTCLMRCLTTGDGIDAEVPPAFTTGARPYRSRTLGYVRAAREDRARPARRSETGTSSSTRPTAGDLHDLLLLPVGLAPPE